MFVSAVTFVEKGLKLIRSISALVLLVLSLAYGATPTPPPPVLTGLAPKVLKEQTAAALEQAQDGSSEKFAKVAAAFIRESLRQKNESLFLDDYRILPSPKGERVFDNENAAVVFLQLGSKNKKTPAALKTLFETSILALVEADRKIAQLSLEVARLSVEEGVGEREKCLDRAEKAFAAALLEKSPNKAIELFEKAWKESQEVVKDCKLAITTFADAPDPFSPARGSSRLDVNFRVDQDTPKKDQKFFVELVQMILVGGEKVRELRSEVELPANKRKPFTVALSVLWDGKDAQGHTVADGKVDYLTFGRLLEQVRNKRKVRSTCFPVVGSILVDATPPTLSATRSPPANAQGWNNSPVTVIFSATDAGSGVAAFSPQVQVTQEGRNISVIGYATDAAGNVGSLTVFVNLDKTAPNVAFTPPSGFPIPLPGLRIVATSSPSFSGTWSDALSGMNVAAGMAKLNGASVAGLVSSTPGFTWTTLASLADGSYHLEVTGFDIAGNSKTDSLDFIVDTKAPQIAFTVPAANAVLTQAKASFAGTIVETGSGLNISSAHLLVDGQDLALAASILTSTSFSFQLSDNLANGAHVADLTLVDLAGNTGHATVSFSVQAADNTPPGITISSPTQGQIFRTSPGGSFKPPIFGTINETTVPGGPTCEISLRSLCFRIDGATPPGIITTTSISASIVQFSIALTTPLGIGGHTFKGHAGDCASTNNCCTKEVFFVISDFPEDGPFSDFTDPVLTISGPAQGSVVSTPSITLSGTATDNNGEVVVTVNGQPVTVGPGGSFSLPLTLSEGENAIPITVRDKFSNFTHEVLRITLDTKAPEFELLAPTTNGGTYVTGGDKIGVSGFVFDDNLARVLVYTTSISNSTPVAITGSEFSGNVTVIQQTTSVSLAFVDQAGNTTNAGFAVTVNFGLGAVLDETTPEIFGGSILGGEKVQLHGQNFRTGMTGTMAGKPITNLKVLSDVLAEGITPSTSSTGLADVCLANTSGNTTQFCLAQGYAYSPIFTNNQLPKDSIIFTSASSMLITGTAIGWSPTVAEVTLISSIGNSTHAFTFTGSYSDTIQFQEGSNTVILRFKDPITGEEVEQSYQAEKDSTAPIIEKPNGLNGDVPTHMSKGVFFGKYSDPNIKEIRVNGTPAEISGDTWRIKGIALHYGLNSITIEAEDKAGNITTRQFAQRRVMDMYKVEKEAEKWVLVLSRPFEPELISAISGGFGTIGRWNSIKNTIISASKVSLIPQSHTSETPLWRDVFSTMDFGATPNVDENGYLIDSSGIDILESYLSQLRPYKLIAGPSGVEYPLGEGIGATTVGSTFAGVVADALAGLSTSVPLGDDPHGAIVSAVSLAVFTNIGIGSNKPSRSLQIVDNSSPNVFENIYSVFHTERRFEATIVLPITPPSLPIHEVSYRDYEAITSSAGVTISYMPNNNVSVQQLASEFLSVGYYPSDSRLAYIFGRLTKFGKVKTEVQIGFGLMPSEDQILCAGHDTAQLSDTVTMAAFAGTSSEALGGFSKLTGEPQLGAMDVNLEYYSVFGGIDFVFGSPSFVKIDCDKIDLDIDSDNDDGFNLPKRDIKEEVLEAVANDPNNKPGKLILVNDGDIDNDGVPDYADGMNKFDDVGKHRDGEPQSENFIPLLLELQSPIDLNVARIKFTYSASNPALMTKDGPGTAEHPFKYTTPSGALRLWRKQGSEFRHVESINNGGDFIASGEVIKASDITSPAKRVMTLYVEGISVSSAGADQEIKVEVDPDGPGTQSGYICPETVRCTVFSAKLKIFPNNYKFDRITGHYEKWGNDIGEDKFSINLESQYVLLSKKNFILAPMDRDENENSIIKCELEMSPLAPLNYRVQAIDSSRSKKITKPLSALGEALISINNGVSPNLNWDFYIESPFKLIYPRLIGRVHIFNKAQWDFDKAHLYDGVAEANHALENDIIATIVSLFSGGPVLSFSPDSDGTSVIYSTDPRLSHAVGANWGEDGSASIKEYTWNSTSPFSSKVATEKSLVEKILSKLNYSALASKNIGDTFEQQVFIELDSRGIREFSPSNDFDVKNGVGDIEVPEAISVNGTIVNPSATHGGHSAVEVTIHIVMTVKDLIDYDFFGGQNFIINAFTSARAAELQAGWHAYDQSSGGAGNIYKIILNVDQDIDGTHFVVAP